MRALDAVKRGDGKENLLAGRIPRIGGELGEPSHVTHVQRGQSHGVPRVAMRQSFTAALGWVAKRR